LAFAIASVLVGSISEASRLGDRTRQLILRFEIARPLDMHG
jgi:hypothetical protein